MAASYALPRTALPHTHSHGHSHIHSHAHSLSASPARSSANTTRSMKHERSSGSLHSSSHSESHLELDHNHTHLRDPGHLHTNSCNHHVREPSPLAYPTPPNSDGLPPARFGHHVHEHSLALSQSSSYEPPTNAVEAIDHHHDDHDHPHTHAPAILPRSKFTTFILPYTQRFPLLYTIMADKDSRRILYFIWLNFTFMLVQAFYGFVTDSLGLLSDSIHMLFDCLALGVGLFASVASKWPSSERFPYGFGKIESLSGFGNGVFLMLISMEIMIEAIERLAEGRPTKRLLELFVVSAMGLAVNLVGMACFGHHGHHGHDHGHDHGHSHSHDEKHSCDHSHEEHTHDHDHDHDHHSTPLLSEKAPKAHSHGHSHDNENMHGIFLHVLADTMGSAAVMVSTALIYFFGWNGFDPLASCIIAVLIFMSSIPLIKSCAKKLLLTVPADAEYTLRETLASVSGLRGVAGYTVPRFWMGDSGAVQGGDLVLGVMHIQATRGSDLEDVKERARMLLQERGMDVVIQVEGVTETGCWCSGIKELNARRYS